MLSRLTVLKWRKTRPIKYHITHFLLLYFFHFVTASNHLQYHYHSNHHNAPKNDEQSKDKLNEKQKYNTDDGSYLQAWPNESRIYFIRSDDLGNEWITTVEHDPEQKTNMVDNENVYNALPVMSTSNRAFVQQMDRNEALTTYYGTGNGFNLRHSSSRNRRHQHHHHHNHHQSDTYNETSKRRKKFRSIPDMHIIPKYFTRNYPNQIHWPVKKEAVIEGKYLYFYVPYFIIILMLSCERICMLQQNYDL